MKYIGLVLAVAGVLLFTYVAATQFVTNKPGTDTVVLIEEGSNTEQLMDTNTQLPLVTPIDHASFILTWGEEVIYNDPVGSSAAYVMNGLPTLILITHSHPDHLDIPLLETLLVPGVTAVAPQEVFDKLPANLQALTTVIANGETTTVRDFTIRAVPMYNVTADRTRYHVKGVGNGYVIERAGVRVYNASDTEITPEFLAESDIDIVFVPVNLPYTMSVEQAAAGVIEMAPRVVYPYHYRNGDGTFSDLEQFKSLVQAENPAIEVILTDWYQSGE